MRDVKSVQHHYDEFLAPVYSWILGDFDTAYRANVELFDTLGLEARQGELAVDLGCGPRCQSLPLAERGYRVVAIDFCRELLDELERRAAGLAIETVCDDLREFERHVDGAPALIACMGDTLVHLPDRPSVDAVIDRIAGALAPGGTFIYSIRDYVSAEPEGAARFVPIRADDAQIFTCFLDYKPDVVHVHDVLYTKQDGAWQFSVSDYLKLRLDVADINGRLAARGLDIVREDRARGMICTVATRPTAR